MIQEVVITHKMSGHNGWAAGEFYEEPEVHDPEFLEQAHLCWGLGKSLVLVPEIRPVLLESLEKLNLSRSTKRELFEGSYPYIADITEIHPLVLNIASGIYSNLVLGYEVMLEKSGLPSQGFGPFSGLLTYGMDSAKEVDIGVNTHKLLEALESHKTIIVAPIGNKEREPNLSSLRLLPDEEVASIAAQALSKEGIKTTLVMANLFGNVRGNNGEILSGIRHKQFAGMEAELVIKGEMAAALRAGFNALETGTKVFITDYRERGLLAPSIGINNGTELVR